MGILNKTFLALDNITDQELDQLEKRLEKYPTKDLYGLKIGLEAFYLHHFKIINLLSSNYNCKIFLDLKLHDIPQTVRKAIEALKNYPIDYLTIHLSGGEKMIQAAQEARDKAIPSAKILGVSYLTSLNEEDFLKNWGFSNTEQIRNAMTKLYSLVLKSKNPIDGIVLSATELDIINSLEKQLKTNQKILKVCPGLRFDLEDTQDQARVETPERAIKNGADFLVMGRPLISLFESNTPLPESL